MKSRVVFVSQPGAWAGPPHPQGSIEIWTHEVARRLTRVSKVRVYRPKASGWTTTSRHDGVDYVAVTPILDRVIAALHRMVFRRRPSAFSIWHAMGYALWAAIGIAVFRPDVVHIQNQFPFVRVIRWINRRVPIVLHSHGEWLTQLDRSIVARSIELVDRIVTPSEYLADKFRAHWPERAADCSRVANGVDATWLDHRDIVRAGRDIVFVGRLSPEKGVHDLLTAFEMVADMDDDATLTIIGPTRAVAPLSHLVGITDDPIVADLERFYGDRMYADILFESVPERLRPRVRFVPTMPHDGLLDVYRNAAVLVNPSLSESFGMSLVEAMAVGTPVVATAVGGMSEILADGVGGVLVPPADPGALAQGILDVIADPHRREELAVTGRARVAARYTWELVAQDVAFVHSGIIDGARTHQVVGTRFEQLVGRAKPLDPAGMTGRTLVIAPHPDDETLGCGGTIAALTAAGNQVGVVFVTDGGLSAPGDRVVTVEERMIEAQRACELLGVKSDHVWTLGFPDGGLKRFEAEAAARLQEIADSYAPVRILAPHAHDVHPDHEASSRIARRVVEGSDSGIELLEYAIWLWAHWPWSPLPWPARPSAGAVKKVLRAWRASAASRKRGDVASLDAAVDIQSVAWRKRAALQVYRSQLPSLSKIGGGRFLSWFDASHELFRVTERRSRAE